MLLKAVVTGLARKRSGVALLIGVTTMLSGVERLLTTKPRVTKAAVPGPNLPSRQHHFSIRQTRSEFGYVYWVLHGSGCYQSFSLHDSWREAMDEANRRLVKRPVAQPAPEYHYA